MAQYEESGQELLFACSNSGYCAVLAAVGNLARCEAQEYGNLEDMGFRDEDLPQQPGLYVWEGSIWLETGGWTWCGSEPIDPDIDYRGKWRPAILGDLLRFRPDWEWLNYEHQILFPQIECPSVQGTPAECVWGG